MSDPIRTALDEAAAGLARLRGDGDALAAIAAAAEMISGVFLAGGRAFSIGNGGSMCDAMHFAEELSGKFRQERAPLPALAVSDPGHLSCSANDYGWEHGFSRFLEAHARPGDLLLAISTSGASPNVVAGAMAARARQARVIALTGRPGSPLGSLADLEICTPVGRWSDRVQELHIKVIHILIELVERRLFPGNYAA